MSFFTSNVIDPVWVDKALNGRFLVRTIIPLAENPLEMTYVFTHEEVGVFLWRLKEVSEFVVSVEVLRDYEDYLDEDRNDDPLRQFLTENCPDPDNP